MALIWYDRPCSVCGAQIGDDEAFIAFEHFLGPKHPLVEFSDSLMHKECFEHWQHHDEFLALHRLARELLERIPKDLPDDQVQAWYLNEAKRLGLR